MSGEASGCVGRLGPDDETVASTEPNEGPAEAEAIGTSSAAEAIGTSAPAAVGTSAPEAREPRASAGTAAAEDGDGVLATVAHSVGEAGHAVAAAGRVVADVSRAAVGTAVDAAVDVAVDAGKVAVAVGRPVGRHFRRKLRRARRVWARRPGARASRLGAANRRPLPYLYDVHGDAVRAVPRDLGTQTVPVERIRGTAVGGATQRGGDFLPLPPFRSRNWEARWQRIQRAIRELKTLPPVDLYRFGDDYWVEDGHNRVAAALYGDQVEIDANVTLLRLPEQRVELPAPASTLLAESAEIRAAGAGRWGRSGTPHTDAIDMLELDPHEHGDGPRSGADGP